MRISQLTVLGGEHNKLVLLLLQIQIQIQIESLHTRLDETDEMTNTALLEGGKLCICICICICIIADAAVQAPGGRYMIRRSAWGSRPIAARSQSL